MGEPQVSYLRNFIALKIYNPLKKDLNKYPKLTPLEL